MLTALLRVANEPNWHAFISHQAKICDSQSKCDTENVHGCKKGTSFSIKTPGYKYYFLH